MSIAPRDHLEQPRALVTALSLAALVLLIVLLTGLLASRLDPAALDQAYALTFTT
ncbi:MAG: hypothetical protein ACLQJR_23120 [Stellaceae bacterium]